VFMLLGVVTQLLLSTKTKKAQRNLKSEITGIPQAWVGLRRKGC
jgi:hypothetical protein